MKRLPPSELEVWRELDRETIADGRIFTVERSIAESPVDGEPRLYRAREDWLQRHDLARRFPRLARRLIEQAERRRRLHDYLLRNGFIWRSRAP